MYREMKIKDALEQYIRGRKVVLMEIIRMPDEIVQYHGTELEDVFRDSVLLVELPDDSGREREKTAEKEAPPAR